MDAETKKTSEQFGEDTLEDITKEKELPQFPTELEKISAWMNKVKFRRKLFGGVDEADVWKKIEELNAMYEFAIAAERTRFNVILEEYKRAYAVSLKKSINATEKKRLHENIIQSDFIQEEKVCDE